MLRKTFLNSLDDYDSMEKKIERLKNTARTLLKFLVAFYHIAALLMGLSLTLSSCYVLPHVFGLWGVLTVFVVVLPIQWVIVDWVFDSWQARSNSVEEIINETT